MNSPLDDLSQLAALIRQRNTLDAEIARIIGRPAQVGHIAAFLAQEIFGIELAPSATQAGYDGRFQDGPFAGCTVNVKFNSKRDGNLDIGSKYWPDFYLVFCGPKVAPSSSRGAHHPFVIEEVFLFDAAALVKRLKASGKRIGEATSVRATEWEAARIFPPSPDGLIALSKAQIESLRLFASQDNHPVVRCVALPNRPIISL